MANPCPSDYGSVVSYSILFFPVKVGKGQTHVISTTQLNPCLLSIPIASYIN